MRNQKGIRRALALFACLVLLLLLPLLQAHAASVYRTTVAVTDASAVTSFGGKAIELEAFNDGPYVAYLDLDAGTASSSSTATVAIAACEGRRFSFRSASGPASVSTAAATGQTASLRLTAYFVAPDTPANGFSSYLVSSPFCQSSSPTFTSPNASTSYTLTGAHGELWTSGQATEAITLSTGGATTDSSANLLPANSIIDAVVCVVTTTITTATDWGISDPTTTLRFSAVNSTMTAGTTIVGLKHMFGVVSTTASGPTQAAAAKLRITTTGTPGAGAVRCTVFYRTFTAPSS